MRHALLIPVLVLILTTGCGPQELEPASGPDPQGSSSGKADNLFRDLETFESLTDKATIMGGMLYKKKHERTGTLGTDQVVGYVFRQLAEEPVTIHVKLDGWTPEIWVFFWNDIRRKWKRVLNEIGDPNQPGQPLEVEFNAPDEGAYLVMIGNKDGQGPHDYALWLETIDNVWDLGHMLNTQQMCLLETNLTPYDDRTCKYGAPCMDLSSVDPKESTGIGVCPQIRAIEIPAEPTYEGHVDSQGTVHGRTSPNRDLMVGSDDQDLEHRAIITFDTTAMEKTAKVARIELIVGLNTSLMGYGALLTMPEHCEEYITRHSVPANMIFDLAPPGGFGSSAAIEAEDFNAAAAASTAAAYEMLNGVLLYSGDGTWNAPDFPTDPAVAGAVYLDGLTQVRMRFRDPAPADCMFPVHSSFSLSDPPASLDEPATIVVHHYFFHPYFTP